MAAVDLVGEQIGQGGQLHIVFGIHRIDGRSAAAAAATDQADLEHVAAVGVSHACGAQGSGQRAPTTAADDCLRKVRRELDTLDVRCW